MAKGKVNPRRKPVTQADVDKAYRRGMNETIQILLRITAFALCDRKLLLPAKVQLFIETVQEYCDEIAAGRLRLKDMSEALHDEYGLRFKNDLYV